MIFDDTFILFPVCSFYSIKLHLSETKQKQKFRYHNYLMLTIKSFRKINLILIPVVCAWHCVSLIEYSLVFGAHLQFYILKVVSLHSTEAMDVKPLCVCVCLAKQFLKWSQSCGPCSLAFKTLKYVQWWAVVALPKSKWSGRRPPGMFVHWKSWTRLYYALKKM